MKLRVRLLAALAVASLFALGLNFVGGTQTAAAHPLGNFTINRLAKVVLNTGEVHLRYVVDMAEIPAFQEVRRIDKDGDGNFSDAESAAYLKALTPEVARNLDLRLAGKRVALTPGESSASLRQGQGGLNILRIVIDYTGALPEGWSSGAAASLTDKNYDDRLGWRDVVVQAGTGVALTQSSVTSEDETAELTAYPESKLKSPPDVREARFTFTAGNAVGTTERAASPARAGEAKSPGKTLDGFAGLVSRGSLTPAFIILSMLAAVAWGGAHALGPGHGKTIVAAYLVGEKGTAKHAAILGLTVTATHTSTVFALGLVTLSFSHMINAEDLYLWLSVGSGLMVVAMGVGLFASRLRRVVAIGQSSLSTRLRTVNWAGEHEHSHAGHGHEHIKGAHMHTHNAHGQSHDHHSHDRRDGHGHSHMPAAPGLRGLIALGISGGLLPCPTALVVMLGAIALDRTAYGLALVLAFSLGLAGVLTGIGLLLVYARRVLERTSERLRVSNPDFTRWALAALSVLSSLAIVVAGVLITSSALATA